MCVSSVYNICYFLAVLEIEIKCKTCLKVILLLYSVYVGAFLSFYRCTTLNGCRMLILLMIQHCGCVVGWLVTMVNCSQMAELIN